MDWVKLATRYYADPKVAALDADAEVLFVRGIAYAGDQETAGFIPEALVPQLARRRRYAECVDALVGAGLWTRAPGGYRMPAWSSWQDQLDVLAARRAADRERKRRKRAEERTEPRTEPRTDQPHTPPLTRDVRGQSADVRVLEGELELEPSKGGVTTHDPPDPTAPPPRRCTVHATWPDDAQVPPCGACGDARRGHDAARPPPARVPQPAGLQPPPVDDVLLAPVRLETDGKGPAAARSSLRQPHQETP